MESTCRRQLSSTRMRYHDDGYLNEQTIETRFQVLTFFLSYSTSFFPPSFYIYRRDILRGRGRKSNTDPFPPTTKQTK